MITLLFFTIFCTWFGLWCEDPFVSENILRYSSYNIETETLGFENKTVTVMMIKRNTDYFASSTLILTEQGLTMSANTDLSDLEYGDEIKIIRQNVIWKCTDGIQVFTYDNYSIRFKDIEFSENKTQIKNQLPESFKKYDLLMQERYHECDELGYWYKAQLVDGNWEPLSVYDSSIWERLD